jgi:hypothetical protein
MPDPAGRNEQGRLNKGLSHSVQSALFITYFVVKLPRLGRWETGNRTHWYDHQPRWLPMTGCHRLVRCPPRQGLLL